MISRLCGRFLFGALMLADSCKSGSCKYTGRDRYPITTEDDRELHYWQKDHVRLYGLDYPSKLEAAGFRVQRVDMAAEVGAELCERYRLGDADKVYRCERL